MDTASSPSEPNLIVHFRSQLNPVSFDAHTHTHTHKYKHNEKSLVFRLSVPKFVLLSLHPAIHLLLLPDSISVKDFTCLSAKYHVMWECSQVKISFSPLWRSCRCAKGYNDRNGVCNQSLLSGNHQ